MCYENIWLNQLEELFEKFIGFSFSGLIECVISMFGSVGGTCGMLFGFAFNRQIQWAMNNHNKSFKNYI